MNGIASSWVSAATWMRCLVLMRYDAASLGIGFAMFRGRTVAFVLQRNTHRRITMAKTDGYQFVELSVCYTILPTLGAFG
jgi:hypothetical protein